MLIDTIHAAARGETLLKSDIISQLLFPADLPAQSPRDRGPLEMTNCEKEVLTWVVKGERDKEIAFRFGITERTVKEHLVSIHNKLGLDSRPDAVSVATQNGLLELFFRVNEAMIDLLGLASYVGLKHLV